MLWPIRGTPCLRASKPHACSRPCQCASETVTGYPQSVGALAFVSMDAESASSSPDKIGHSSCRPVRQASYLMSCFALNTYCSQGIPL